MGLNSGYILYPIIPIVPYSVGTSCAQDESEACRDSNTCMKSKC